MIKIIDATLTKLDEYSYTKKQVQHFIQLMGELSVWGIAISPKVYKCLEGDIPKNIVCYLEEKRIPEGERYPGVHYIISPFCDGMGKFVKHIQINDVSELSVLSNNELESKICLTGLDDIMLYNGTIYNECMVRIKNNSTILYPENAYYCATAIGVSFCQYYPQATVMSTFTGMGQKAATEQILIAMHVLERYKPNLKFEKLQELRELFEDITGVSISEHLPIIGRNIFHVESGIHVDGIVKKPTNYESFPPELVGAERKVRLGKHSGAVSIKYKLKEAGLSGNYNIQHILNRVKNYSLKHGGEVRDEEFLKIARECECSEKKNQTG